MKKFFYSMFVFLVLFSMNNFAQEFVCGMSDSTSYRSPSDKGGVFITSEGTINALFIFIQFRDDTTAANNTPGWPISNTAYITPDWIHDFAGQGKGITQYFDEMSNGILNLTGYIYPTVYVTQHEESYYSNIKYVNEEALIELDPYIDYSQYDNWNGTTPGSDGVVDMIFLIYRDFHTRLINYSGWTGYAALLLPYNLVLDNVTIAKGFSQGSGVQMRGGKYGFNYIKYVAAHEFGHHLFGAGHLKFVANLALMTGKPTWNASRGMISWEREKLDWIDYQDKSRDDIIYVSDYYTTDDVYRIPLSSSEYYLIENRQKISQHDYAGDKGIYIYHVTNADRNLPTIKVECADGNWHFTFHPSDETITRDYEDRNSNDNEMNYVKEDDDSGKEYFCAIPWYPENAAWGDDEDAFDLSFNNVFSPVSNPPSSNSYRDFTVEITNKYGDPDNLTYLVNLFFNHPYAGKPAKVINFNADFSGTHPHLTWDANLEPDLYGYKIYKKLTLADGQTSTSSIFTTGTSYTDNDFTIKNGRFAGDEVEYWIVAEDNSGKLSAESKHYDTRGSSNIQWKPIANNNIKDYKISQNYPNPFNPSTIIKYQLPNDGFVNLSVYNSLGERVKVLVNGTQQAGYYTVNFNASSVAGGLPSGIYFYTLKAGKFTSTKKMILVK